MDERDEDRLDEALTRIHPRTNELPVVIPYSIKLGRTADAAVQLTCIEVYQSGLLICVDARARAEAARRIMGPVEAVDGGLLEPSGDNRLQVVFAGGDRLEARGHRSALEALGSPPPALTVLPQGGGSPRRGYELRLNYWLTPRPDVDFVVEFEWTGLGIGPSRTPVSLQELHTAYAEVAELWP